MSSHRIVSSSSCCFSDIEAQVGGEPVDSSRGRHVTSSVHTGCSASLFTRWLLTLPVCTGHAVGGKDSKWACSRLAACQEGPWMERRQAGEGREVAGESGKM